MAEGTTTRRRPLKTYLSDANLGCLNQDNGEAGGGNEVHNNPNSPTERWNNLPLDSWSFGDDHLNLGDGESWIWD